MNIIQSICKKSNCYKAGKTITVKGLMIHSVGCSQPKASVFINNWNKAGANACVHAIIEPSGDVYQLLPWNYRGWHGGGSSNNTHIGVEMTEPSTIKYTSGASWTEAGDGINTKAHVLATYKYAVELFSYLCKKYNLNPLADGVIISHSEGYKRGITSNHSDVEHLWNSFGLTMEQFRKDIISALEADENCIYPSVDLKTIKYGRLKSKMNIRDGASTKNSVVAVYKQGTIVEIVKEFEDEWYKIRCKESKMGYAYVSNTNGAYITVGSSIYTVQRGDSLWNISQNLLGKDARYTEIKELNHLTSDKISIGIILLIP